MFNQGSRRAAVWWFAVGLAMAAAGPVGTARAQGAVSKEARAKAIDVASLLREAEAAVRLAGGLTLQVNRSALRDGDTLVITIELPRAGYLNVLSIDASGVPTVLYPNKVQPDAKVDTGRFTLPTAAMGFELQAAAPFGRTTVSAFLTQEPMNLYTDDGVRNVAGAAASAAAASGTFSQLSAIGRNLIEAFGTKSLEAKILQAKGVPMAAGMTTVLTCAKTGPCDAAAPDQPSRFLQILGALTPGILREAEPAVKDLPTVTLRGVNDKGMTLTKASEGFVPQLYEDTARYCSIAYGHLLRKAGCAPDDQRRFPRRIPEPDGAKLLATDMARAERAVQQLVTAQISDAQYAALCDFTYNVGSGNLKRSTLLKVVNAGDHGRVPSQFRRWTKAGGVEYRGLKTRREREIVLFFDGAAVPKAVSEDPDNTPLDIDTGERGS